MEVVLEIEDKKATEVLSQLKALKYTRIKTVKTISKERILKDLKQSVKEVNLAKEGKMKLKSFDEFLNELWYTVILQVSKGCKKARKKICLLPWWIE